MNTIDLLILHGPPGAGKSSLATEIASNLSRRNISNAVIELDDLARIYPRTHLGIMYKNLEVIWTNYESLGDIKVIIPTYLQKGELEIVKKAAPTQRTTVCEVIVPIAELKNRIEIRETDQESVARLFNYVKNYQEDSIGDDEVDFKVQNHSLHISETVNELLSRLGW